jgi:DNA-binding response OmpR family regulator
MKVLVVDDDQTSSLIAQMAVRNIGHECEMASDGIEAWNAFLAHTPDVVISDWLMPGLTGLQLCCKIRAHPQGHYTYFIMATRQDGRDRVTEGMEAGADDYLVKPLDPDDLQARLDVAARVMSFFERLESSGTALVVANNELARRNAEFKEAVATQHRFISAASHELKAEVAEILSYLVKDPESNGSSQDKSLDAAQSSAKKLSQLVDDLTLGLRSEVETLPSE